MPTTRCPRIIYDYHVQMRQTAWVYEVRQICKTLHLPDPNRGVEYDMDNVQNAIQIFSRDLWWEEALKKPKLRSYIELIRARVVLAQ